MTVPRRLLAPTFPAIAMLVWACGGPSSAPSGAIAGDAGSPLDGATGSGDASVGDARTGGPIAEAGGSPIVAPSDQWTWVDFPDSRCASGTPTGLAVNPHSGSMELVLYLEGGGSCTDATSCWGPTPGANNLAGYDATTFAGAKQLKYPLLDRSFAANPITAMNIAYVPYCTGDLHGGSIEVELTGDGGTIPTYFWGARDMDAFLARLVPTFPGTTRVWLLGTSAGGFGTVLNYDRVAKAFGVRVDIIDDSGPPIPPKGASDNATLFQRWAVVPPGGCTECTSVRSIYDFDRQEQPGSRFAFLSFEMDTVIAPRFGYTLAEYPAVVQGFSSSIASDPNAATYLVTNESSHVVESDVTVAPQYLPWLTQMITGDPAWKDAMYAHP